MNNGLIKRRVNLDGFHSLDVSVCEEKQTVITELIIPGEKPLLVYAEKFDKPCNYLKSGIKRGIEYLGTERERKKREMLEERNRYGN